MKLTTIKTLCLICAAVLLALCLTGCGGEPDILSDAEEVMAMVMDLAEGLADPNPPVQEPAPQSYTPEPESTAESAEEIDAVWAPTDEQAPATAEMEDEPGPGRYTGADGSVLTVAEDGTCTYETDMSDIMEDQDMAGTVTFHGTMENGKISFTKVTYFGLDITVLAETAGFSDPTPWEQAAESLYIGE